MNSDQPGFTGSFYRYSDYLRQRYGARTYRVAVDAGFSCPNRRIDPEGRGCSYCDADGARASYVPGGAGVEEQIHAAVRFLKRRYEAEQFLLYFQAYTNTDADVDELAAIYRRCLELYPFRALIVSTRPDSITPEKADLLAGLADEGRDVWVELGLQSAHDGTLARISRGHTVADFERAYRQLRERGISVAVHLIFGLPGEGLREVLSTVSYVAGLAPDGVKIHNLVIPEHAPLYRQYLQGELAEYGYRRHLEYIMRALELLPPSTVIMRLTCDMHSSRPGVPKRRFNKARVYQDVERLMREQNRRQGAALVADRRRGVKEVRHAD
ncbi:TIGR01212 family radical SAM protein [Salinispira pacifica]